MTAGHITDYAATSNSDVIQGTGSMSQIKDAKHGNSGGCTRGCSPPAPDESQGRGRCHQLRRARTLQAFDERLRAQVDLDALKDHLVATVQDTMQPAQGSLWQRDVLTS